MNRPRDRKEQQIAALPLFSGCRREEIRWVASHADALDIPADTTLAIEGKGVREFIVILDGEADADGATLRPGAFFGHMGLVDQLPHEATVRTTERTRALVFEARVFHALVDHCPTVARHLMRDLVTEIRGADRKIASGLRLRTAW